jgi:hypothetical protein
MSKTKSFFKVLLEKIQKAHKFTQTVPFFFYYTQTHISDKSSCIKSPATNKRRDENLNNIIECGNDINNKVRKQQKEQEKGKKSFQQSEKVLCMRFFLVFLSLVCVSVYVCYLSDFCSFFLSFLLSVSLSLALLRFLHDVCMVFVCSFGVTKIS